MAYFEKLLSPAMILGSVLLLASCATDPSVTDNTNVKKIPEGYKAVSICYSGDQEDKAVAEKLALDSCPEGTTNLHLWDHNAVMNSCPILKRRRITFLCALPSSN